VVCEGQFPSARPGRSTLTPEERQKRNDSDGRAGCPLEYPLESKLCGSGPGLGGAKRGGLVLRLESLASSRHLAVGGEKADKRFISYVNWIIDEECHARYKEHSGAYTWG
jgi:hypothetical protein